MIRVTLSPLACTALPYLPTLLRIPKDFQKIALYEIRVLVSIQPVSETFIDLQTIQRDIANVRGNSATVKAICLIFYSILNL
jgi:hypothetical protein